MTSGQDDTPRLAASLLDREALDDLPDPEPMIDRTLDRGTVVLLYGKWGSGKSFLALDWAASIAMGRKWQGRTTQRARVLYIAAEGAFGLKGRADAWERCWGLMIGVDALTVLPEPVNLTQGVRVAELCELIAWGRWEVIVIDTLARCMVGADENSAKDAGIVVDALTRIRQATPGGRGLVIGVHHTGKDNKTARGSSAIEAGVDTVYQVTSDGGAFDLIREKRKDGPVEDRHRLKVNPVEGTRSAAIVSASAWPSTGSADKVLAAYRGAFAATGASKSELRTVADMAAGSFHRGLSELVKQGALVNTGTDRMPFYREPEQ